MTTSVTYLGNLRTSSVHLQSGDTMLTDAPTDNNGKGEAFSPTDTVANALATCMFTIMAIKCNAMDVDLVGSTAAVTKIMAEGPRRISKIKIVFEMACQADEKTRTILEKIAFTCPVHLSLHPDIERDVTFNWQ
ncbi:OsmC family protein [Flavobacterium ardleyense]|uniref:OsmC family protein n=1 Tax=Flavobacterium ardleyense TaxID=2038737 RepID=UPI00298D424B|nr:OsmC family protein [Flavobacterium ardleyense]